MTLVFFGLGFLAPIAFATSHGCDTYWSAGDHWHEGTDINNECSTSGHAQDTVEYFLGWGGDDTLDGGAGIDRIKGQGGGYDVIYGGYGLYDVLEGGSGVVGDRIYGENDVDYIYGGENRDQLKGQEGNDYIYDDCCGNENEEKDRVCGSGGYDYINVQDKDPEDNIWDPGGGDNIIRDNEPFEGGVGVDGVTTSDCPF